MAIPSLAENPEALEALSRAEVLYSDLDGTLLGVGGSVLVSGDGEPSIAAAEAIVRLNTARMPVVITTGRNRLQCNEITRLLGWRGFIAELGCVIVEERGADPMYYLGDWPADAISPGDTPFLAIERSGALSMLQDEFPGRIEPHAPYHLDREATHVLRGLIDLARAAAVLRALELPIEIIDNGVIHPKHTGLIDLPEIHAYHLLPSGVHKPGAVARDLEARGLARDQAAGIGDSATDVEIADAVGVMGLVANAIDDARVVAAASGRSNVIATSAKRGDGWAEFATAWMRARGVA